MNTLIHDILMDYWSKDEVVTNILVFVHIFGALLLGLVVGYERAYHGRAAGMRTYGLVCMASASLTVVAGFPEAWFGGHVVEGLAPDPTRVIQGIVTGIGFLGAGVIMKEGFNISGLTTAASIWATSAIGVLVGVGFYAAAMLVTLLSASLMMWMSRFESWLPAHQAVAFVLRFEPNYQPGEHTMMQFARDHGYQLATGTLSIEYNKDRVEWRFVAVVVNQRLGFSVADIAKHLSAFEGIESFQISHARN